MLMREVEGRLAARPGAVQHVIVLLPVPIVYPKIPVTESVLASISSKFVHPVFSKAALWHSQQLQAVYIRLASPRSRHTVLQGWQVVDSSLRLVTMHLQCTLTSAVLGCLACSCHGDAQGCA